MQSLYHNLASFDGVGEMQGQIYASRDEEFSEENKSYSLEISGAYPKSAGVLGYRRSAKLEAGKVSFTDKVELDTEREIDFILMTHVKPELCDGGISLAEGCTLHYDSRLNVEIEVVDPVGMDALSKWGSEVLYRMHFRIKAKDGEFSFTVKA